MKKHAIWFIFAGVIAVLVGAFVLVYDGAKVDKPTTTQTEPENVKWSVNQAPVEVTGEIIGEPTGNTALELSGTGLDGQPVQILNDNKPKLLIFVAHWCPVCQKEVPVVAKWLDQQGNDGVDVYIISTAAEKARGNWPASEWLQKSGITAPMLADSENLDAAQAYKLDAFPYFVAIDKNNKIVATATGALEVDELDGLVNEAGQ